MTVEFPRPQPAEGGGRGWSIQDGEFITPNAEFDRSRLDNSDVARFMSQEAAKRLLAIEAIAYAFEITNPSIATEQLSGLQRSAASFAHDELEKDELAQARTIDQAREAGVQNLPSFDAIVKMGESGFLDQELAIAAGALLSRIYLSTLRPAS